METEVTPTPEIEVQARTTQKFYIVRRGEYLTGIAKRLGISWRLLAKLNNLTTPYILYTGQKLRLP
jgi:LysM repeat protein